MSSQELSPVFPLREEPFTLEPGPSKNDSNFFQDITAYVEVRSQAENRSRAIAQELRELGVTVCDRLGPNITHIVYRQGCRRTAQWAERHEVPLVSVSWIQACKKSQKLLPTEQFPAEAAVSAEGSSPGLYARRRMRSMQPKSLEEDLKLSSERKRRAARRNGHRNELRRRAAEAEELLWSCENNAAEASAKPDSYFADPCIYVAKTPPSMKEFVERRGRRYSVASVDSISPVCSPPKQLSLGSANESGTITPIEKQKSRSGATQTATPVSSLRSPRRKLNLSQIEPSMSETPSSLSSSSVSQRSLLFPARKLFDASSFSGMLIEPKNSSNRLQDMCSVFPKAFQKRKILGANVVNEQRKRNRHSEQPLTKASFLFDDSGEESEADVKVDQEALTSRSVDPEPAAASIQESDVAEAPVQETDVPEAPPGLMTAVSSGSIAASSTASEADICAIVRDCTRRDRRSRASAAFKRAEAASESEPASPEKTKQLVTTSASPSPTKAPGRAASGKRKRSVSSSKDVSPSPALSKTDTISSLTEASVSQNNISMDSLNESSYPHNNSTITSLNERIINMMKKPSSTRRQRASFAAGSSDSASTVPTPSRRLSSQLHEAPAARRKSVRRSVARTPPKAASRRSSVRLTAPRVMETLCASPVTPPKASRRSSVRLTAPRVMETLCASPVTPPKASRRCSVRLTAPRVMETLCASPVTPPKASRRSGALQSSRGTETPSTSPTPPVPGTSGSDRQWSCDVLEGDRDTEEKVYGVLPPRANPPRRSKRLSMATVLESLVCHDSPSSSVSSASVTRRARPSLDDFRSPSSSRQKREVKSLLRQKRVIVLTSLHKREQTSVTNAVRALGAASLREKVDKTTTHVVTKWPLRRTLSLLRARLLGLPVLVIDWMLESREAGRWLPEEKYLIKDVCNPDSPGPQRIFDKCGAIFVSNEVTPPQRELLDIIKLAGGQETIVRTPENAQIIIRSSQESPSSVDPKWVLDSVMANEVLPLKNYLSQE